MLFHGSCMCLQSTQFLGKGRCRVSSQDCEDVSFNQRVVKQQYGITYLLHPALAEMGLVKAAKLQRAFCGPASRRCCNTIRQLKQLLLATPYVLSK